ncbi:MAG TPA: hypothetical protein VEH05_05055 [Streptosporangiaceae bacterium]|nr:hypothetical protein [Streptosporangiaceae bacterium]
MNSGPEYPDGPDYPDKSYEPQQTEILDSHDYSPRRRPHLLGVAAVAVLALAAGGGITYVATHSADNTSTVASSGAAASPAPSPSTSPGYSGRHGGFGRFGGFFGGFGLGGLGGVIHGQVTEPKSGGGYQTVDVQRGTVSAVSSSSITVQSADGYTATYAVIGSTEVNAQAAGIGTVKDGDTVELTATVSGGTATAASIIDLTSIQSSRGSFNFPAGPSVNAQN